ncbi:aminoglycoside phosphotransferase family protein [Streptomyces sulphureus]|uniref:aminoglycoside phosphotransferase family protein n=1 Tax=Streptomyces sulphureus TaxID=47758 RepID=UPI00036F160E|nr:aminoglycoside phosphotransferase family protein [Streptomyces sulphureus]
MSSVLPLEIPRRLSRTLAAQPDAAAATGAAWLEGLGGLLERSLARWELVPERVVSPGGRSSLVVLVHRADGEPAALKLLAPLDATPAERGARERAALAHWDGLGAVHVLEAEPEDGVLLLERLRGEMSLRSLPEAKAVLEAASTVRRLWVGPPAEAAAFETVTAHTSREAARMRACAPPQAQDLVEEALETREELLRGAEAPVLLHGDFRQGAVLASDSARARWLAAGPDPLVGEPAFDLARLARDRLHDLMATSGAAASTRRRVNRLADSLDIDRERLRGWTLYRAVESGVRQWAGNRADAELLLEFATWL